MGIEVVRLVQVGADLLEGVFRVVVGRSGGHVRLVDADADLYAGGVAQGLLPDLRVDGPEPLRDGLPAVEGVNDDEVHVGAPHDQGFREGLPELADDEP